MLRPRVVRLVADVGARRDRAKVATCSRDFHRVLGFGPLKRQSSQEER